MPQHAGRGCQRECYRGSWHTPAPFAPVLDDREDSVGAPHLAYLAVVVVANTCLPSPCRRLSRPPWSGVTPTTTMEAPLP